MIITLIPIELRYLVRLCDAETNRCGLDTDAGLRARAMGDKLTAAIITYRRRTERRSAAVPGRSARSAAVPGRSFTQKAPRP